MAEAPMEWLEDLLLQADAERKEGYSKPLIITAPEGQKLKLLVEVVRAAEAVWKESGSKIGTGGAAGQLKAALDRYHGRA